MNNLKKTSPSVGIDLGTTFARVGVWKNNNVEIATTEQGNRSIPMCVAFTDSMLLVGDTAKSQATGNIHNTVFDVTRLIGRKFADPELQRNLKHWPFKVVCGPDDKPRVAVQFRGERRTFQPVEILAMLLVEMRGIAETCLGVEVKDVVLTVPACFNLFQRQAIKDAAIIAGLNVVRLISGATAASIAYGLERKDKSYQRIVLAFDLGGATMDVSLLAIEGDIYEVLATASSSTQLGGEDFDRRLVELCVAEFRTSYLKDLWTSPRAISRLQMVCEQVKRGLSTSMEACIDLNSLHEGRHFHSTITRARFEVLCADLFEKLLLPVHQVLSDANVLRCKVDDVILVGGAARIPKVEQILKGFFNGKTISTSARSEEAAVHGATVHAAMLTEELSKLQTLHGFMVLDVVPLSLKVEIDGMTTTTMIPRGTTIPTKKSRRFTTSTDNQSVMKIRLFEGESEFMSTNCLLVKVNVDGIPRKPRGESEIEVTLHINVNAILTMFVVDKSTGKEEIFTMKCGRLADSEIERMRQEVKNCGLRDNVQSKTELENFAHSICSSAARRIAELKRSIESIQAVEDEATETLRWVRSNSTAKRDDFEVKRRRLEDAATSAAQKQF